MLSIQYVPTVTSRINPLCIIRSELKLFRSSLSMLLLSGDTTEAELCRLFSAYGNVKSTKIIVDRAGVSKGYGFVTFETEHEAQRLQSDVSMKVRTENQTPNIGNSNGSDPALPPPSGGVCVCLYICVLRLPDEPRDKYTNLRGKVFIIASRLLLCCSSPTIMTRIVCGTSPFKSPVQPRYYWSSIPD